MAQGLKFSGDKWLCVGHNLPLLEIQGVPHLHENHYHGFYQHGFHYYGFWLMHMQVGDFHVSRVPLTVSLTGSSCNTVQKCSKTVNLCKVDWSDKIKGEGCTIATYLLLQKQAFLEHPNKCCFFVLSWLLVVFKNVMKDSPSSMSRMELLGHNIKCMWPWVWSAFRTRCQISRA